jgi:hypothetical protein
MLPSRVRDRARRDVPARIGQQHAPRAGAEAQQRRRRSTACRRRPCRHVNAAQKPASACAFARRRGAATPKRPHQRQPGAAWSATRHRDARLAVRAALCSAALRRTLKTPKLSAQREASMQRPRASRAALSLGIPGMIPATRARHLRRGADAAAGAAAGRGGAAHCLCSHFAAKIENGAQTMQARATHADASSWCTRDGEA